MSDRWQRIKELFPTVLELAPELRAAWLAAALPEDPALAAEVEALAAAHDGADDFYDRGALAAVPELREQLEGGVEGMRIGPYRIVSELGRGGMGAVYLAVRDEPGFKRQVAIKLVKRGMDTDEIVRRFVAERQILASLAHPNIARLFEGGTTADGRPYFIMEHIEGRPITVYAEEHGLTLEARLHLFLRVCRAVQHAHQSFVVHRDLKPANILVDAEGEPKLLDFGIAKLLVSDDAHEIPVVTRQSERILTPEYASPEQQSGGPVTTATDVYGLGLLLYELLVGHSPRSVERKLGEGWSARLPSQAVRGLAVPGDAEARRRARRLAGDLDAIVGKALEPDPARRFATVSALAEDLERHLTRRPVSARRPTRAYRLGRLILRHRVASLATALVAVTALLVYQTASEQRQRRQAEAQRERAQALNDWIEGLVERLSPEKSERASLTVKEALDAGVAELSGRDAHLRPETWAPLLESAGRTYGHLGVYEKSRQGLEQALALRRKERRPSREASLDLADNLTVLGQLAMQEQKLDAGRAAFGEAIAIKQRLLGPAALPLADDWNGLGMIALDDGDAALAERHLARALSISRLYGGEGQKELADSYNNLGRLAAWKGEYARAQVFFQATLHLLRASLGEDHPATDLVQGNFAFAILERGDLATAEVQYREVTERRRRRLEPDHPQLSLALLELATVQRRMESWREARATLSELLEIRRSHPFPADQDEAEIWHLSGLVHLDEGRLDDAERALDRSAEIYGALPGEHRQDRANVLGSLARLRAERGDLAGAVPLARRGLELTRAAVGQGHPSVASFLTLVGGLALRAGQARGAEIAYRQALEILADERFTEHRIRAYPAVGLGELLVETGRAGEARPYLEAGLRIHKRALPAGHSEIAQAESHLGACYAALGDGRARSLLESAHTALLARLGADHPSTRQALDRLRRLPSPG